MQATFTDEANPTVTLTLTRHEAILLSCLGIAFDEYQRSLEAKGSTFCKREGVQELYKLKYEIQRLSDQLHANDLAWRDADEDWQLEYNAWTK